MNQSLGFHVANKINHPCDYYVYMKSLVKFISQILFLEHSKLSMTCPNNVKLTQTR
jgi:hypothetical protein